LINAKWHKQHPMPMGSTLSQRVQWHVRHAKACGCREIPPTVLKELRRRGEKPPKRRMPPKGQGGRRNLGVLPTLLAGGNPQISKADGDAPVQAYIAAMPGWKLEVGRRLDALIVRAVPGVRKAVKWNSPFYGIEGRGWFLSFHCFTKYVKVTFFRGMSLRPPPPGESKQKEVRYLDVHENEQLDEAQLARWVKQASQLPGWHATNAA
jgi:hypothetical protein